MLTENQNKAINMLIEGNTKTAVANDLKISRTTLYKWLDDEEFTAEMHRRGQKMCDEALNDAKLDVKKLLGELKKMALTSENENIKLSAINSLLDRILGKAVARQELSIDNSNEESIELDELDTLLDEDNVINLEEKKAK